MGTDEPQRVPEGPGLGVEVDEEKLAAAAARQPIQPPRYIGVLHLPGGHRMLCPDRTGGLLYGPNVHDMERITGVEEGSLRGVRYERWVDDGSDRFASTYERLQRQGAWLEPEA